MLDEQTLQRFGGIGRLYGQQTLEWLTQSHVCVIGIGGVGSWSAEALARSAIGQITLIDMDDICITNTNRQLHAIDSTQGMIKVDAMCDRILSINPNCLVNPVSDFISKENLGELIHDGFDLVIDAIDSVQSKAALIAHCKRRKIPLIVAGGAGGQTDPRQITSGDLAKTTHDPLLSKIRNILRREYNFSKNTKRKFGVECIYSTEQLVYPQPDGSVCEAKSVQDGNVRLDCSSGFGAATMVTASFGLMASARGIDKIIAKRKRELNSTNGCV
ncbi:tRNA cyclic N6-threonylcarbamoyladenosine(37) synthase TcdA [Echinimonas agarilytica]|uniref:tRNA threonylcarbamoyladenosine dehydratase n=1 Tax=Echinimonas agarilytica TaxID=1215918 RepID=A0AA41W7D4_9GAMM|nr:tRNA cyclic N6-threonylcarbamoyladenosine(37) synthase TcdA [Echinimonas agarilytica]MCM2680520.1 tRNA cyclic N6-threonylcarbamoyladenosine(37) synthase TcdA [Echinimonas agarilytica]